MIHAIYFQSWNYTSACLGWVSMPVTNTLNFSPCCLLLLRAQTAAGKWVFMIYNCPIIIIFNRHIMMNERSSLFSRRDCHEISSTTCERLFQISQTCASCCSSYVLQQQHNLANLRLLNVNDGWCVVGKAKKKWNNNKKHRVCVHSQTTQTISVQEDRPAAPDAWWLLRKCIYTGAITKIDIVWRLQVAREKTRRTFIFFVKKRKKQTDNDESERWPTNPTRTIWILACSRFRVCNDARAHVREKVIAECSIANEPENCTKVPKCLIAESLHTRCARR